MINTVLDKGTPVYTERKKQKTLECLSAIAHLTDWRTGSITPQNYIGLSPQVIEQQYWPQYSASERGEHTYTYGWCMKKRFGFNQIQQVVDTLKKGEKTAFAQFWNPVADSKSPDPPCIDIVAFQRSKEKINLIEYIRSNDIARAWPEDVSGSFAVFLTEVAANFGGASARGDVLTVMGSAHVYETAIEEIRERFRSSYSSSNLKPAENTSSLFGPVLHVVKDGEKCSNAVKGIAERYSRILDEDGAPLYVCLKVHLTKQEEANATKSSETLQSIGELGRALEYYEGKNDKGEPETVNQVEWASSKAETTPESRRIVLTPNDPSKREYSINPMIIQFLIREKTIHTIALYKDVNVEGVDRNLEELLTITREVGRKKRSLKLGPLIVVLAPVLF
jgi:thymidylate synthase